MWKQPNCPLMDGWRKPDYIYTMRYDLTLQKGNPVIRDNMDESEGHYAVWNKPDNHKYCKELLLCGIHK